MQVRFGYLIKGFVEIFLLKMDYVRDEIAFNKATVEEKKEIIKNEIKEIKKKNLNVRRKSKLIKLENELTELSELPLTEKSLSTSDSVSSGELSFDYLKDPEVSNLNKLEFIVKRYQELKSKSE